MDSIISSVTSLWKTDLEEESLGWEVKKLSKAPSFKYWDITNEGEFISLYKRKEGYNPCCMIVIHNRNLTEEGNQKSENVDGPIVMYNVARLALPADAEKECIAMRNQFTLLFQNSVQFFKEGTIKLLIESYVVNKYYGPAHVLVKLGMYSHLKHDWIQDYLSVPDENGVYPVHVACIVNKVDCLKEFLVRGLPMDVLDDKGNSCLHYCAQSDNNLELLSIVLKKHPNLLMATNEDDMSALHVACMSDSLAIVKALHTAGHPLSVPSKKGYPLHLAMRNDSHQCMEYLCEESPEQLSLTNPSSSQGEFPLHMVKSRQAITALIEQGGASTEARNSVGKTALHVMCDRRNVKCLLRLLACDANPDAQDDNGNTPMHCAVLTHKAINTSLTATLKGWVVKYDEVVIDLVRALLVFGADPDKLNDEGVSVRHIVSCQTKDPRLLRTLVDVGAVRCPNQTAVAPIKSEVKLHCSHGCSATGDFNGDILDPDWIAPDLSGQVKEFISVFDRHFNLLSGTTGSPPSTRGSSSSSAGNKKSQTSSKTKPSKNRKSSQIGQKEEVSSSERNSSRSPDLLDPVVMAADKANTIGGSLNDNNTTHSPRRVRSLSYKERYRAKVKRKRVQNKAAGGANGASLKAQNSGDESSEDMSSEGDASPSGHKFSYAPEKDSHRFGKSVNREHILCLDGGGIRGLLLLICLRELQKHLKRPLTESFDWFSGTSTGGMVAVALCMGLSISKSMGMYFRFKDEVFQGMMRPYDHAPFEKLLKDYFTEEAVMTDIKKPKVLISTVLGDRVPPDLFFFSNVSSANSLLTKDLTHQGKFPPTDPPHKQVLWQVLRATSAAPLFFSPFGRMLDGGLMCNNPTLDTLTEVFRVHESLYSGSGVHSGYFPPRIGCVVSCGTGFVPVEAKSLSINKPSGFIDGLRSVTNLIQLTSTVIDQATVAEGRPVAQAQTWCQMCNIPYVRFNPPVSADVALNETSDSVLLKMCWEAQCYVRRNQNLFYKVAKYIDLTNRKKRRGRSAVKTGGD